MRRIASRILLVGLVAVVLILLIMRADANGNALVDITRVKAEDQPIERAFVVNDPMRVAVEASGSFESGGADSVLAAHGWLVHRETGRVVWRMRPARRPERGSYVLMRDTLALEPGTYDAVYTALGDPLVRAPEASGGGLGSGIRDFFSRGGRGWVGDADRWRLVVEPATSEDRGRGDRLDRDLEIEEPDSLVWSTGPARSLGRYETTLRVSEPVQVHLDALFESTGGAVADSAMLVSAEGDTLWTTRAEGSAWAGGSIKNRRQSDTLSLPVGQYRAVYVADADHAYDSWTANPPWQPWKWGLRIAPADSAAASGAIVALDPLRDLPRVAELFCVGQSALEEVRLEVLEPIDVQIVAVGELVDDQAYDFATLVQNGEAIWDMRTASLTDAGGARKNRMAEETLSLVPGVYTLRYQTDGSHHCDSFGDDGPDRQDFWGVVLLSADGEEPGRRVRVLSTGAPADPLDGPEPPEGVLTSLTRVESDREVSGHFQLGATTDVCVMALGEIDGTTRRDWARIALPKDSTVWEMTADNSYPVGGAAQGGAASGAGTENRVAIARLTLPAGRYITHFVTDGSHAWGDWVGPRPPQDDLWGVQVWSAPTGGGPDACRLEGVPLPPDGISPQNPAPNAPPEAPEPPAPAPPVGEQEAAKQPVPAPGLDLYGEA